MLPCNLSETHTFCACVGFWDLPSSFQTFAGLPQDQRFAEFLLARPKACTSRTKASYLAYEKSTAARDYSGEITIDRE